MKTMLSITKEFLQGKNSVDFKEIFNEVELELRDKWTLEATEKNISYEEICIKKTGELYKIMTVDKSFKYEKGNTWSLNEI
ncbi:DNA-directed RNA polymerase subunit delta [Mycoplasma phocimorsus]|uniref:DNA-directed RNA polymerase subunit delta n=1 Tax=Mycoplasma phocimorsus TaxID=3045839 RepID=UPI0024BF44F2|nr:hypothetical protein [Mycoplasma phocimorsus]MDJ1646548.1 hypothetical protein [Mycoplasma phocimorsus]MDJ1647209.1 hypothetical protein [Mycoplasma phocimorsus]MDJ1647340.1 hypothetical protein [Mycoplasma phocimorsus]MDJ1648165.1 hypothetical protein [Mycoplasma phocimorsus]